MNKQTNSLHPVQRIGIDKLKLYKFDIIDIDFDYLTMLSTTKNNTDKPTDKNKSFVKVSYVGDSVRQFHIVDNTVFNELTIGYEVNPYGEIHEYCHLTLTVADAKGNNAQPMSHSEYTAYLNMALSYIAHKYRVKLGAEKVQVLQMEINTNIPLKYTFMEYHRVLNLLFGELVRIKGSKIFHASQPIDKDGGTKQKLETIERRNGSEEVIGYDKRCELQADGLNVAVLPANLLRIEWRLKKSRKVASELGTNFWFELNDEIICTAFYKRFYTESKVKFIKWKTKKEKELTRLINDFRKNDSRNWINTLIFDLLSMETNAGIPFILDLSQVTDAFMTLPDKHRRRTKVCKEIKNNYQKNSSKIFANHDLDKIEEIFGGIQAAYEDSMRAIDSGTVQDTNTASVSDAANSGHPLRKHSGRMMVTAVFNILEIPKVNYIDSS